MRRREDLASEKREEVRRTGDYRLTAPAIDDQGLPAALENWFVLILLR